MPKLTLSRRRFLVICAACAAFPAGAAPLHQWRGTAMGAAASIHLAHPEAEAISARAMAEISRLEDILSLHRAGSALARLNRDGVLDAPPFELLEVLSLAGRVHAASGGLFDPTIQPLWQLYATAYAAGLRPGAAEIAAARARTGWSGVAYDSAAVRLAPGRALTLNGIAQGYVADRVADLLRAEGLRDILINTGEHVAIGGAPTGGPWPVTLAGGGQIGLADRALATSAPLGTCFDQAGLVGHILNPATGLPTPAAWRSISISARSAALADALSTAACLMPVRAGIARLVARFPSARIESIA